MQPINAQTVKTIEQVATAYTKPGQTASAKLGVRSR